MDPSTPLPSSFYRRPAEVVAPELLGRWLVREADGVRLVVRIVEVEAYLGAGDRASHAWGDRRTERTSALFRDGGSAYVYLIYGLHSMFNVVTGTAADGSAVLVRAGEPLEGIDEMRRRRGFARPPRPGDVAGGPGKLCQALAIDLAANRTPLDSRRLRVTAGDPEAIAGIAVGARIGIDYAGEATAWPLRFAATANAHVSRPRPEGGAS